MLRCWKVLVPTNSMAGFDVAIAVLERLLVRPEQLVATTSGAVSGEDGRRQQNFQPFQLKPL
jgi:hypothetical protein